jgi:hypothetical protein
MDGRSEQTDQHITYYGYEVLPQPQSISPLPILAWYNIKASAWLPMSMCLHSDDGLMLLLITLSPNLGKPI